MKSKGKIYSFRLIISVIILTFSSCIKDVDYKLDFEGSKMVVFAGGEAGQKLGAQITRTIAPLTQVYNPDSLVVNDALIELFENDSLIDTLNFIGDGLYESNVILKEEKTYSLKAKAENLPNIISGSDIVPIGAKILDAKIEVESVDSFGIEDIYVHFNTYMKTTKSIKYPFNSVWIYLHIGDKVRQIYYFLNSESNFIECENCYRLLDSPCVTKLGDNTYELINQVSDYEADYLPRDIDSVQFVFATFSSLSEKLCLNGLNYEQLINNPLPFASNPSVNYSNIEGGYGIFLLGASDTLTIKF